MNYTIKSAAFALCLCLCSLSSQAAFSQDFSSLDSDLQQLENLITDTLANTQEQQELLNSLKESLNESGQLIAGYESTITAQETLLKDLQHQLTAMSETYRTQSALSERYERSSRFWRTFTLIAIPVTAVISGTVVLAAAR
jgi:septal ring factor EnvC (AmiA/AmiB activator)